MKWDFVILNEQSTLGENYIVNGVHRVRESKSFYGTVGKFVSKINRSGAKAIIISLYPQKNAPKSDGETLDYSYMKIAEELDIGLSPISYTWKDIIRVRGSWQLYREDNLHPTPLGSFITATTLYSSLTNSKSRFLNGEITGPLIEESDGIIHRDSIVCLIRMDKSKSQIINEIAYENVKKLNESGGYFPLVKPDTTTKTP